MQNADSVIAKAQAPWSAQIDPLLTHELDARAENFVLLSKKNIGFLSLKIPIKKVSKA